MKKINCFSSFFAALAVFSKIYKIMKQNNLSFRMLTHIKEVDAEKKVKKIIAIFRDEAVSLSAINEDIRRCEDFYLKHFGRVVNLSAVKIPEQKFGMNRLYVIIPGISIEKILAAEQKCFAVDAIGNFRGLANDRSAIRDPYAF